MRYSEIEEAMAIRSKNLPPGVTITPGSLDLNSSKASTFVGEEVEVEVEVFSEWSASTDEEKDK